MKSKGFTLIEMMAVIAMIGILASAVLANYDTVRERAHLRDAESTMQNARGAVETCMFRNENLQTPNTTNAVCAGSDIKWPDIAQFARGWSYDTAGSAAFEGDVSDRKYLFRAQSSKHYITCTHDGCATSELAAL